MAEPLSRESRAVDHAGVRSRRGIAAACCGDYGEGDRLAPSARDEGACDRRGGGCRARADRLWRRAAAVTPATTPTKTDVKVGLAYDIGGRGDKSFNDSAAAGLEQAKAELDIQAKELPAPPNETEADKYARLRLLCQGGLQPGHRGRLRLRRCGPGQRPAGQGRQGLPEHQVRHHRRRGVDRAERRRAWSSPRSRARSWSARRPR